MDAQHTGEKLKYWRDRRGLTQAKLAHGLFDRSYISQIESGSFVPPLATLQLLCHRLDIPITELVEIPNEVARRTHRQAQYILRKGIQKNSLDEVYVAWQLMVEQPIMPDFIRTAHYLVAHGLDVERMQYMLQRTALKMLNEGYDDDDGTELLVALGNAYYNGAQYLNALSVYQTILQEQRPDARTRMRVSLNMGSTLYALGRYEEAADYYLAAIDCATQIDNRSVMARCHHGLGIVHRALGDLASAQYHTAMSMELYRGLDDLRRIQTLHNLAVIQRELGHTEESAEYLMQCYRYYETAGHSELAASALEELALNALQNREPEAALDWCDKGLEFVYQADNLGQLARLLELKVRILMALGQTDTANTLAPIADNLRRGIQNRQP